MRFNSGEQGPGTFLSEALPEFDGVSRAFRRRLAGKEDEVFHLPHAELRLGMGAQERTERGCGDVARTGEGDVRVEGAQVGLEAGAQDGILEVLVEGEKVRVPGAGAGPDGGGPRAAKGADAADGQEEWRHIHLGERGMEALRGGGLHVAEEAEREVKLIGAAPGDARQVRVEVRERFAADGGEFEAEEETFRHAMKVAQDGRGGKWGRFPLAASLACLRWRRAGRRGRSRQGLRSLK